MKWFPNAVTLTSADDRARRGRLTGRRGRLAAIAAAALIVVVATAFAVHDLAFQLDGDASITDIVPFPGVTRNIDWDSVLTGTGSPVHPFPAGITDAEFTRDFRTNANGTFNTSDGTTFTGGSKDTLDINAGWRCVGSSNVTNKGDLTNAYAAQYVDPSSGDRIIYFGMEKYVPQGTNNVGIWFLQDSTVACPEATTNGGNGTPFTGAHVNGDLLIVSAFDNGGSVSTILVYSWQNGALNLESSVGGDCRILPGGDQVCGSANTSPIVIQWPHASNLDPNKQPAGSSPNIPAATFFEGGIDVSAFPAFQGKCFTRFLFNTRSSTATTATLYDYTLGDLNTCAMVAIEKKTVGGTGSFSFTSNPSLGLPADANGNFSLTTTASANPAVVLFESVQPGSYAVRELVPADWNLTALQCVAEGPGTTAGQDGTDPTKANITVGFGGVVDCTYEDTLKTPKLTITKTPDAASVNAGDPIGFTITLANSSAAGTGTAKGAKIDDNLPGGSGTGVGPVTWAESPDNPDCAITGAVGSQHVTCGPKDLAPGASITVHLLATTAADKCGQYDNTASFTTTNDGSGSASASITCRPPKLTITKTADAASVNAGDPIGFTVTLANSGAAGTGTAKGAKIDDNLPGGTGTGVGPVTWAESPDNPDCTITGAAGSQHLTCGPKDLAPGASISVHLLATTAADKCGQYDNTASFTSTNDGSGSASASITCNKPTLTITKTADAPSVNAGDPIGFTVTLTNSSAAGTGTAKGAKIDDDLPGGAGTGVNPVTWIESPDSTDCAISGTAGSQHLTCGPKDLAPGASITVHLLATTAADKCGQYDNTASFTTTNNGSGSASASIMCRKPNLTITKTADAASVNAGDPIGFTVTLANSSAAGTGTAKGAKIDDDLPSGTGTGVNPVTWAESPDNPDCTITGTIGSQHLTCGPKDLAPGASITVHLTATTAADKCGQYDNTASFTSTNNGSGSASASITCKKPNLSLTKAADAASVNAGDPICFTVTLANSGAAGTGTAKGAKIDDDLPGGTGTGVNPVTWTMSPNNTDCTLSTTAGSQHLTCGPKDLAPGDSISVHVCATTAFDKCGQYDNTARFTSGNDGSGSANASITCHPPKLTVTKTADNKVVDAGNPIGFTITVSNSSAAGTGTAKNVTLSDPLPPGTGVSWSIDTGPTKGTCSIAADARPGQTLTCSFGDLAPGGSVSLHIASATTSASAGVYANTATAMADNHPPVTGTDTIVVQSLTSVQHLTPRDTATVTGSSPTGNVVFQLFGPGDTTCSGTPVYSTTQPLSGGTAKTPDVTIDTATFGTGTFRWKVHYNGDLNNQPADSDCGVESVSVTNG